MGEEDLLVAPSRLEGKFDRDPGEENPDIAEMLRRISGRFRGEVGFHVSLVEDDLVYLSGDGSTGLLLPGKPIHGPVQVKISGREVFDFEVGRRAGMLRRRAGWPDGLDNIEVTFTHGYEHIPEDIQDAVLAVAEAGLISRPGVRGITTGSETAWFFADVMGATPQWTAAVAKYKITADRS